MAQSVDKLKELLFDREARAIDTLSDRVTGVEQLTLEERRIRQQIGAQIEALFNRAGTQDKFEVSVAEVLDGALRRAEVDRHAELASAMAPLVVRTVKTEIRNSQDELVEALYPMTGRMVQAYVASAMKDLANQINRKLEQNPVMLRLQSLTSGKSVAELAMADAQRLEVEELYLIRRGSGELIGRWPQVSPGGDARDHVMSGVLTAINEFSSEALKDDGGNLRQIDLGERQLYLRVSPSYLLAAKCSGSAPAAIETILDETFLEAMEDLRKAAPNDTAVPDAPAGAEVLADLSRNLETRLEEKSDEIAANARGASPLRMLVWLIGLPLVGLIGWFLYGDYQTERARSIASKSLSSFEALNGYPVSFDVSAWGRDIDVSGLAPNPMARDGFVRRLSEALPKAKIVNRITVLPNELATLEPRVDGLQRNVAGLEPEIEKTQQAIEGLEPQIAKTRDAVASLGPQIAKTREDLAGLDPKIAGVKADVQRATAAIEAAARRRALERAALRLQEAQRTLEPAAATGQEATRALALLQRANSSVSDIMSANQNGAAINLDEAGSIAKSVRALNDLLIKAGGLQSTQVPASASEIGEPSEDLALQAERAYALSLALAQGELIKRSIPRPVDHTPREKLVAFAQDNAVFFKNDTDLRSPSQAKATLDKLAELMRGNDVLVRVVGYTDAQGPPTSNLPLSEARSNTIIQALMQRGVEARRLVKIGRVDAIGLSEERGAGSPNRRVEFEIGFIGENAP